MNRWTGGTLAASVNDRVRDRAFAAVRRAAGGIVLTPAPSRVDPGACGALGSIHLMRTHLRHLGTWRDRAQRERAPARKAAAGREGLMLTCQAVTHPNLPTEMGSRHGGTPAASVNAPEKKRAFDSVLPAAGGTASTPALSCVGPGACGALDSTRRTWMHPGCLGMRRGWAQRERATVATSPSAETKEAPERRRAARDGIGQPRGPTASSTSQAAEREVTP